MHLIFFKSDEDPEYLRLKLVLSVSMFCDHIQNYVAEQYHLP